MRKLQVKPSKFLLNPVRALNFWGGGRSWSGRGDEGRGGVACQFFHYYFCFACLYKLIK